MVTFSFPTEGGNSLIRSGKIREIFENLVADLKHEAVYLYPIGGLRGGHLVVNMTDSADVARIGERFWFALGARVELTPVMGLEDLAKGLTDMGEIIQKFGA